MTSIEPVPPLSAQRRNNVSVSGVPDGRPMMFAHGFGCSQEAWRHVIPQFTDRYRTVAFDNVGAGGSELSAYDPGRYDSLDGYAGDVLGIIHEFDLHDLVYIGHSVSSMIGVLAAIREPERFGALILVGPSPRYVDDLGYTGGFSQADIENLLDTLDANYLGWSAAMAPVFNGNAERPELSEELTESFCRVDPKIARHFARVAFLSDNRSDLALVTTPTLIMQDRDDVIAPTAVGEYVHAQIAGSRLVHLEASGHVPNLSAPDEVAKEITAFLG
jgi:sigma-B regulation protein RsbQ